MAQEAEAVVPLLIPFQRGLQHRTNRPIFILYMFYDAFYYPFLLMIHIVYLISFFDHWTIIIYIMCIFLYYHNWDDIVLLTSILYHQVIFLLYIIEYNLMFFCSSSISILKYKYLCKLYHHSFTIISNYFWFINWISFFDHQNLLVLGFLIYSLNLTFRSIKDKETIIHIFHLF